MKQTQPKAWKAGYAAAEADYDAGALLITRNPHQDITSQPHMDWHFGYEAFFAAIIKARGDGAAAGHYHREQRYTGPEPKNPYPAASRLGRIWLDNYSAYL